MPTHAEIRIRDKRIIDSIKARPGPRHAAVKAVAEFYGLPRSVVRSVVRRKLGPTQRRTAGRALTDRNAEIVRLATTPGATGRVLSLAGIARLYGIGRERVRQIVKAAGIDVRALKAAQPRPVCHTDGCRNERGTRTGKHCQACMDKRKAPTASLVCANPACPRNGEPFERRVSRIPVGRREFFCRKVCQGQALGRRHGFGTLAV